MAVATCKKCGSRITTDGFIDFFAEECDICKPETAAILERLEEAIKENKELMPFGDVTYSTKYMAQKLHYIKTGRMITKKDLDNA